MPRGRGSISVSRRRYLLRLNFSLSPIYAVGPILNDFSEAFVDSLSSSCPYI